MASDINSVTLVGRLTRDPELRTLPSGQSVCEVRLAVNSAKKSSAGEWTDVAGFYNVTVWGKQAEALARYQGKGDRIAVSGRLDHRTWESQDGNKREAVSVVAQSIQFLGTRDAQEAAQPVTQPTVAAPVPNDDDIPF